MVFHWTKGKDHRSQVMRLGLQLQKMQATGHKIPFTAISDVDCCADLRDS